MPKNLLEQWGDYIEHVQDRNDKIVSDFERARSEANARYVKEVERRKEENLKALERFEEEVSRYKDLSWRVRAFHRGLEPRPPRLLGDAEIPAISRVTPFVVGPTWEDFLTWLALKVDEAKEAK